MSTCVTVRYRSIIVHKVAKGKQIRANETRIARKGMLERKATDRTRERKAKKEKAKRQKRATKQRSKILE